MHSINLNDYDAPLPVLISITKIIGECISHNQSIKDVIQSDKPEINRFINDCITALN